MFAETGHAEPERGAGDAGRVRQPVAGHAARHPPSGTGCVAGTGVGHPQLRSGGWFHRLGEPTRRRPVGHGQQPVVRHRTGRHPL